MIIASMPSPPPPVIELTVGQALGFAVVLVLFFLLIGPKE